MADELFGVTDAAAFTPEVWAPSVGDYLQSLVGLRDMIMDYSGLITGPVRRGDVIHIPSFGQLTAEAKSEDTDVEPQSGTHVDNSVTMNQIKTVVFKIENVAEVQTNEIMFDAYVHHAGEALHYDIENYISGTILQAATTNDVALTTDNTMTTTLFLSAVGKLLTYNVPVPKDCFYGASPATYVSTISLAEMNAYEKTGSPGSRVAGLKGFEIPLYSSTTWDQAGGAAAEAATLWHKSCAACAIQQEPTVMSVPVPRAVAIEASVTVIYGSTLLFEERASNFVQVT